MKLIYGIDAKPPFGKTLVFAFQQMISIMAATLLVPMLMTGMTKGELPFSPAAALLGAGMGTIVYLLFTKRKSPVFLGSSFTFLGAYGAVLANGYGYWGVILGIAFAGLVYVVLAVLIKFLGSGWVNKLMPAVIVGPIVTLIGLSLSGTATGWMSTNGGETYNLIGILCGLATFITIVIVSTKGKKMLKLIPFIVGIGAGYVLALLFTVVGIVAEVEYLQVLSFQPFIDTFGTITFESFLQLPSFTLVNAIKGGWNLDGSAIGNIALTFIPIAIVELAQHIADHKNLSSIVEKDLITDPGLHNTLLGDGIGSIVGGLFGGAANTTYGESIGCVALSKNASTISILFAAFGCIVIAFFSPFVALINSIPKCVMGGACVAMYGFIAVSGLQMLKQVDLSKNNNLFVVASILVVGIGGLTIDIGTNKITGGPLFQLTSLATALVVGLIVNAIANSGKSEELEGDEEVVGAARTEETAE
ncbi:MAG: uracil-xanthine permease [Clostridia bacterium]|nr:uracil-xanthine permease [Clostridia bacterium]